MKHLLLFLLPDEDILHVIVSLLVFIVIKNVNFDEFLHVLIIIGDLLLLGDLHGLDVFLVLDFEQDFLKPLSVLVDLFLAFHLLGLDLQVFGVGLEIN